MWLEIGGSRPSTCCWRRVVGPGPARRCPPPLEPPAPAPAEQPSGCRACPFSLPPRGSGERQGHARPPGPGARAPAAGAGRVPGWPQEGRAAPAGALRCRGSPTAGGGGGAARAEGQSRRGAAIASLCLRGISHPNLDHVGLRRGGRAGAAAILPEPGARLLPGRRGAAGLPAALATALRSVGVRGGFPGPSLPSPLLPPPLLAFPLPGRAGGCGREAGAARLLLAPPPSGGTAEHPEPRTERQQQQWQPHPPRLLLLHLLPALHRSSRRRPRRGSRARGRPGAERSAAARSAGRCGLLPSGRAGAGAEAASRAGEAAPAMAL